MGQRAESLISISCDPHPDPDFNSNVNIVVILEDTKDNISNDKTAFIYAVLVRIVFNNEINPKHVLDENQQQLFS